MRASLFAALAVASVSAEGPCDILEAAGTPCVAAHSTVRALFVAYGGPLYNVTRASDGKSFNVPVLAPGGFADKKAHDAFCPALDCVISNVFDQTTNGNHLGKRHGLVNASEHPITVGGTPVYGMYFAPGFGYRAFRARPLARYTSTHLRPIALPPSLQTSTTRRALPRVMTPRASLQCSRARTTTAAVASS